MISIVTGTLNRVSLLPDLIKNTVDACDKIELVLVDGGSTDGTIEYIRNLNNKQIKLIEVGKRSTYPHFMNLGIKNASYEWVCQWNDDVLLNNSWDDVISQIDNEHMFYLFNWKYGSINDLHNCMWLSGDDTNESNGGFCILDSYDITSEIVMNYGIYNKKIFREIGMYNSDYTYYYADGDMSRRAYLFGYKYKSLPHIKVISLDNVIKVAIHSSNDVNLYNKYHIEYKNGVLSNKIEML